MKATITNLGEHPVPLTSTQGAGLALSLDPAMPFILDDDAITVATVGDNPSLKEDARDALGHLYDLAVRLVTFWRAQPKQAHAHPVVHLRIVATEGNAIRVTGDDKNLDQEIVPGSTTDVQMANYVELRQLGV